MGPDPTTGLLTGRFTVYYGVGDLSTGGLSYIKGIVSIEDPIETFPVRQFINTHNIFLMNVDTVFLHFNRWTQLTSHWRLSSAQQAMY